MKRTKTTRIICSALAVIFIMTCFIIPSSAAGSSMLMGISSQACKGNLSSYSFPANTTPTQGETMYLNFAATKDYYFDRAEFYIKAPGQSSFTLVRNYNPVGYFRWCNHAYTFSQSGTYTFRLVIVATSGTRYSGDMTVSVKAVKTTQSTPDSRGVTINWNPGGKTSTTRNAAHTVVINGTTITPGSIHATYYKNGTRSNSGSAYYCQYKNRLTYVGGAQCMGYAYYIQLLMFGVDSHTTVLKNSQIDDGVSEFYGVRYNRKLSASEYKQLIQRTGAGTHLRCRYNTHSIVVLRADSNGFYYTDANTSASTYGANNIKVGYTTYADFAAGSYGYLSYVEYYHG